VLLIIEKSKNMVNNDDNYKKHKDKDFDAKKEDPNATITGAIEWINDPPREEDQVEEYNRNYKFVGNRVEFLD
jgi:hypothetical protein